MNTRFEWETLEVKSMAGDSHTAEARRDEVINKLKSLSADQIDYGNFIIRVKL